MSTSTPFRSVSTDDTQSTSDAASTPAAIAPLLPVVGGTLQAPLVSGRVVRHVNLDYAASAPAVDRTFFVYGGSPDGSRALLCLIGSYDHKTGRVSRPVTEPVHGHVQARGASLVRRQHVGRGQPEVVVAVDVHGEPGPLDHLPDEEGDRARPGHAEAVHDRDRCRAGLFAENAPEPFDGIDLVDLRG